MMRNKDIREKKGKKQGKVYLVGAGPGNPEYLTVRAMKLIRRCDVLLYDRLVDLEIVNLSSASCERICVGTDHGAEPSVKQDRINELMLDCYVRGMTVVRLKSGDPFIFGRGGEEVEFLRRNSVQYEIVPGLTSAISVATAAGIPLTHREHSSSVLIISGHRKGSGIQNDWSRIAKFDGTIVILMGVGTSSEIASGLIENGMDPLTGVAVIENGTKPEQRVFSCFLRELPRMMQEFKIRAPSVIVIGRVINALIEGGMLPAVDLRKLTDMFSTPAPELSNTAAVTRER
ncbi:MAG: uroporphyrinogen-III C-methyltransferase [Thermoplasmata archaeon]